MNDNGHPRSRFSRPAVFSRHAAEWVVVAAAGLLIIAVIAAAWLSYRNHSTAEREFALRHADDVALVLEAHARNTLLGVDDAVRYLKWIYERDGVRADIARIKRQFDGLADAIAVMSVADAEGRLILSNLPIPPGAGIADLAHFRAHVERDTGQLFVNKPVLGRVSGKWSFHLTRRINRPDGSFGGVAIIAVDLSYWDRLLREGHFGDAGAIALIGRDGAARAVFNRGSDDKHALMQADWTFMVHAADAAAGRGGRTVAPMAGSASTGNWAYRETGKLPLLVAVSVDEKSVAARLNDVRTRYIGGVVVMVLLIVLLAAGLLRFFSRQRQHAAETARMVDALRQSEELYRQLFETNPLPIIIRDDASLNILAVNQAMMDKYGYTREQFAGMTTPELQSAATRDAYLRFVAAHPGGVSEPVRRTHVTHDGAEIKVDSISRLFEFGGKAARLVAFNDVTAQECSERAIRDSEERLRTIAGHIDEGLALFDQNDCLVFFNEPYARMAELPGLAVGWTFERVLMARAQVRLRQGEISDAGEFVRQRLAQHRGGALIERESRRTDGGYHLVREARTAAGQTVITLIDITELKRREADLRDSEQRFRTMFDHAGVGISTRPAQDRHAPWLAVNDKFCEMTGYSREELLQMSTADITAPAGRDAAIRDNRRLLAGEVCGFFREKQLIRKDGSLLWVALSVATLPDAEGRPYRIIATYQDIHARKIAEERLRESEGRLSAIIEAEPECVATIAPDGTLLDMNPAGLRMLGAASLAEMRRRPLIRYVAAGHRRAFADLHRRVLSGRSDMLEFEAAGLAGRRIWMEIHAVPLRDASGQITALLGIARDVTERRMARMALAAERNLLRSVIDNLPDRIRAKDRDRRFILANTAWLKARAPGHHDVTGLDNKDLLRSDEMIAFFEAEDRAVLETGQTSTPREVMDESPDDPRWYVTTKMPLRDGAGDVIGIVGISRDVTDIKQRSLEVEKLNAALEQRVAERTAQLSYANEELEAFAASVSHDLRAPLRGIDGFAAGLIEDYGRTLDTAGQHMLGRIRTAAARMSRLIEDLLRLSRVARTELAVQEVDVGDLARAIVSELRRENPDRKVTVNINPDLRATADPGLLRTALVNLLQNAWKFTGNIPEARIEVGSVRRRGTTAFFVRDNGAGFDMDRAERLFGAFQRLHTDREFPGTGVGLATVRRVMRRHGGDAWAESAVGRGAVFFFTLSGGTMPEQRAVRAQVQPVPVPASPAVVNATAHGTAILLVDDDPDVLMLAARALRSVDCELLTAGRGEEAVEILRVRKVDVIVSDFSMPGMNGAQLLTRAAMLHPDTLRIIVSGQEVNHAMQEGLRKGEIHHYFDKQYGYGPVRTCIRDWLAANRPKS